METYINNGRGYEVLDLEIPVALANEFISQRLEPFKNSIDSSILLTSRIDMSKFVEIRKIVIHKEVTKEFYDDFVDGIPADRLRKDIVQVAKNHYAYSELVRMCEAYITKCKEIEVKGL